MNYITRLFALIFVVFGWGSACFGGPIVLARDGGSSYRVVISRQASETEEYAAKELTYFLGEISGVKLQVITDAVQTSGPEIVLGKTSRLSLSDIPAKLRPKKQEGYVIYRKGDSLYILGGIPRGTLYGVYDLLEMELGCRFLAPDVNYIPKHSHLSIDFKSRKYDPPMEYRQIWTPLSNEWLTRRRMNVNGPGNIIPIESKTGNIPWIRPTFCHSFGVLIPASEYFAEHPEYFALVDGKRVGRVRGDTADSQPCLSNPDVFRIVLARVKQIAMDAQRQDPTGNSGRILITVSENDNDSFCQCDNCKKINAEEGSPYGGTLMRFVNGIAREIAKDHPNVDIETLAYGQMPAPPKTKPEKNVVIRWARWLTNAYPLDSKSNKNNWGLYNEIRNWHKSNTRVYHWGYYTYFGDYLAPYPHLNNLDNNIRILVKNGVTGMFGQCANEPGAELLQLRAYLLTQCMWRPETNGRKTIEEFCHLYYGKAGNKILEYVNYLNNNFKDKVKTEDFPDSFVVTANQLLSEAEGLGENAEIRHRVAVARMPIWKMMLERSYTAIGKVVDLPIDWNFKFDADDSGLKAEWFKLTSFTGWQTMKTTDWWTNQGETRRGIGWYAATFEIPNGKADELALFFGAIDGYSDIYVDEEKIGEQKIDPAYTWNKPLSVKLPATIGTGKHTVVVRVFKPNFLAGIWRPVTVVDNSQPIPANIREAGERFISVGKSINLIMLRESSETAEGSYYPVIQAFLDSHK